MILSSVVSLCDQRQLTIYDTIYQVIISVHHSRRIAEQIFSFNIRKICPVEAVASHKSVH